MTPLDQKLVEYAHAVIVAAGHIDELPVVIWYDTRVDGPLNHQPGFNSGVQNLFYGVTNTVADIAYYERSPCKIWPIPNAPGVFHFDALVIGDEVHVIFVQISAKSPTELLLEGSE